MKGKLDIISFFPKNITINYTFMIQLHCKPLNEKKKELLMDLYSNNECQNCQTGLPDLVA